jgi:hypothetical protein
MELIFPKVWFATDKLMNNQARLLNFSDGGSLGFEAGVLQFRSQKQTLKMKNIEQIDLVFSRIPWISVIVSFVGLIAVLGFIVFRMPELIFIFLPFLTFLLPLLIFTQKAILWVEVVFVDDENVLRHAYFLDRSRLGSNLLGSLLEDTLKMYKELRSIETAKAG